MKVMMAMVIVMKVILIVMDVMTRVALMMMMHVMEAVMKEAETAAVMTDSYSIV